MRLRIFLTVACAITLGVWAYTDQKYRYSGGLFEDLHASGLFILSVLAFAVATGFVVRRVWALLALLGPLLALGYLQATGYVSPWNDGNPPLLSLPSLSSFFWFGLMLLLGWALRRLWDRGQPALRGFVSHSRQR
jgi:hypothetical protein